MGDDKLVRPRPGVWRVDPFEVSLLVKSERRRKALHLCAIAAGTFSIMVATMSAFESLWIHAIVGGIFGITFESLCKRFPFISRARRAELDLLEHPDDPGLVVVQVLVRSHGKAVGIDRGVAWVGGGLLHFRGLSTYFGIRFSNLSAFKSGGGYVARLLHLDEDVSVRFEALRTEEDHDARSALRRLGELMEPVMRERPEVSEEQVDPPLVRWIRSEDAR